MTVEGVGGPVRALSNDKTCLEGSKLQRKQRSLVSAGVLGVPRSQDTACAELLFSPERHAAKDEQTPLSNRLH